MKKLLSYIIAAALSLLLTGCMDIGPISAITDANYWKNPNQVQAFNQRLSSWIRSYADKYIVQDEIRSNIYSGISFSGEAPQDYRRSQNNTLRESSAVVGNYGRLYTGINQVNLMIDKMNEASYPTEVKKTNYLGGVYGMRVFLYFRLLRTYGDVIVCLQHTERKTIDLGRVVHKQDATANVMKQIRTDITASEAAHNSNYKFTSGHTYWSLAATKILEGEVYLWNGKQMGSSSADYQATPAAYQEVQNNADVNLLGNFEDVFVYDNKENKEIIYALHNRRNKASLWGGLYTSLVMNKQNVSAYRLHNNADQAIQFSESKYLNLRLGGDVMRFPLDERLWTELYSNGDDKRKKTSLVDVYQVSDSSYMDNICNKFHGVLLAGSSTTSWYDDQPIYHYAKCLLGIAEAKVFLGQDPSTEINRVRRRVYGATYFNTHTKVQYPNDVSTRGSTTLTTFYTDNPFVGGDEDPIGTILEERMREFLFKGKRWHDIRLIDKVTKYSTADVDRLLWSIDETTKSTSVELKQTPGYGD